MILVSTLFVVAIAIVWLGWTLYKLVDSIGQDMAQWGDE